MSLLDRYIARQFFWNILLLLGLVFSLVVVVDFSLNFDEFTGIADRLIRERGWQATQVNRAALSFALVLDLWWPRLAQLFHYVLGLAMVGAMGFTCAQLTRHREFVAVLAGGISLHRVVRPVLLVAFAMTCVQIADTELLIPRLAPLLTREKRDAGTHAMGAATVPLCADPRGNLFYARSFDFDAQTIDGFYVWERDKNGLMSRRIEARAARWDGSAWVLTDGTAEVRDARSTGTRREITPIDRYSTDLDPTALRMRRFENYSSNLSVAQASEMIRRLANAPDPPRLRLDQLRRVRTGRFATMACNLLTLLICMPFFVRREPVNMIVQSLYAAPVALAAVVGGLVGATAAIPGLPADVSPFVPVMILLPVAIGAISGVRT